MSTTVQDLPCHGDPNFTLFDGSKIVIQGDEFLPPRMVEYLNDTMGHILTARVSSEKRLVEIDSTDPTLALKSLYSNRTLFRYTHRYFVFQETHSELSFDALSSLATRFGIDLPNTSVRLNVYPKSLVDPVIDLLLEKGVSLSPTTYTCILAVIRCTDPSTKISRYLVGFSPSSSGLDHQAAYTRLEDESNISRAFYKIQEACERCGVKDWPQPTWNAVDIGAAPGGWSLYLSEVVGRVFAVDPAELVVSRPNIVHLKGQLLHVLDQLQGIPLHMIVCDMNADPADAIECMKPVAEMLQPGGRIIWTLKYPKRATSNIERRLKEDVEKFKAAIPTCEVVRTMHLVSNHHERTLIAVSTREPSSDPSKNTVNDKEQV